MSLKQWIYLVITVFLLIMLALSVAGGYDHWGGMPDVFDKSINKYDKFIRE